MSEEEFIKMTNFKQNRENWRLTRINQGYEMTRISGQTIECRKLNMLERLFLFLTNWVKFFINIERG